MKFYQIDYIYFLFPIMCLLFSMTKKFKLLLSLYLVLFLGFSKVGADYEGYLMHFDQHRANIKLEKIHGEILFKLYMKLFVKLGISYEIFRIFHIVLFLSLICYFLYKISENYYYSLFILYCGYIIYLCSAYRQLVSMCFLFIGVYFYKKSKLNKAILLNILGLGFHISSIFSLMCFLFFKIKKINISKRKILFLIVSSLILRFSFKRLKDYIGIIMKLIGRKEQFYHYVKDIQLLPFGLISRVIFLIIILFFYKKKNEIDDNIFYAYTFSMLLYFLFPFELIMGRLTNNGRILECLLIASILKQNTNKIFKKIVLITWFLLILLKQMLVQYGYYPYENILF